MAIAIVANVAAGGGANSITSGSIDTTGANLLLVCVSSYSLGCTVSDNKSNSWTGLTLYGSTGAPRIRLFWSVPSTVGSGHTFTATGTGTYPAINVLALSGAAASPYDAENGAAAYAPGSVSPSEDNEIVVTGFSNYYTGVPSIDSGMTVINYITYSSGVRMGGALAYKIQTTAASIAPTWTGPTSNRAANIACFKAAATSAIKTIDGLAKASVKTVNGLAIASLKTWGGLA